VSLTHTLLWIVLAVQAPPDSAARAQMTQRLRVVAESLGALRGAAAHFRRDLDKASDQLIRARAKQVRASCTNTLAVTDSLAVPLAAHRYTPARGDVDQRALQTELTTLRRALFICRGEWDASLGHAHPDSLRAWGPFRLTSLEGLMRRYEQRAVRFRGYVDPAEAAGAR